MNQLLHDSDSDFDTEDIDLVGDTKIIHNYEGVFNLRENQRTLSLGKKYKNQTLYLRDWLRNLRNNQATLFLRDHYNDKRGLIDLI